jgi:hypothetical protein
MNSTRHNDISTILNKKNESRGGRGTALESKEYSDTSMATNTFSTLIIGAVRCERPNAYRELKRRDVAALNTIYPATKP